MNTVGPTMAKEGGIGEFPPHRDPQPDDIERQFSFETIFTSKSE